MKAVVSALGQTFECATIASQRPIKFGQSLNEGLPHYRSQYLRNGEPQAATYLTRSRPNTIGHCRNRLGALAQTHALRLSPERNYAPMATYPKMLHPHGARAKTRALRDEVYN